MSLLSNQNISNPFLERRKKFVGKTFERFSISSFLKDPHTHTSTHSHTERARPHFQVLISEKAQVMSFATFGAASLDEEDWENSGEESSQESAGNVHIRIQQRNGRKTLTTVQGLPSETDFPKLLKAFKKQFCCNGCINQDPEMGQVIQLQGDQRQNVKEFIVSEGMVREQLIKIHGF